MPGLVALQWRLANGALSCLDCDFTEEALNLIL